MKQLFNMAKHDVKTIVFSDAYNSPKLIEAIRFLTKKGVISAIILGKPEEMFKKFGNVSGTGIQVIDPEQSEYKTAFATEITNLRKDKGITEEQAQELLKDNTYFAIMLVKNSYADAAVVGNEFEQKIKIKPALQLITTQKLITSSMLYVGYNAVLKNRPIVISDCAINENPTSQQLVEIAAKSVEMWKTLFFEEPKVAFLSYSNHGTASSPSVEKMQKATKLFQEKYPDVISDGEIQLDQAILTRKRSQNCQINGDANILIAPDLNSANLLGKAIHYVGNLVGIGPITMGFERPVSVLTQGATAEEMVFLCAITAIQAQL